MKSSVYIGQEHIEAIGYIKRPKSLKILDYVYAQLPERTMINGNIAEAPALTELLTRLKLEKPALFKRPSLVIDSTSLSVKEIPVPKLGKKQYLKIVRDELAVGAQEETVIDYRLASAGKKRILVAVSTGKAFLRSYLDVFGEAGIRLESVRVGLETVVSYVKTRPELKNKTFALNIIDGISMLSVVFSNGRSVFSTRSRLTYDNELGLIQSVADNVPSLTRFMKSEKLPDIEKNYYLGLEERQLEMLGLHGENLAGFDLMDGSGSTDMVTDVCHMSFMCPFNEGGINLIESYKNSRKYMREYKQASRLWVLPVAGALIIAALYAIPTMLTRPIAEEVSALESYLNDPRTVSESEEIDGISAETARMGGVIADMEAALEESAAYGRLTEELINLIMRTDESVIIESFRVSGGAFVSISGSSDTETDSARYVEKLNSSALIGSVGYTGYRYDNSGRYRFTLQAELPALEEGE